MSSRRYRSYAQSRTRRRPCSIHIETVECHLWTPPADEAPMIIADIAAATDLVFDLFEMPMRDAALLMFDADRALVAMLLDPPAEIEYVIGWARRPENAIDFCQTILVIVDESLEDGPAPDAAVQFYDTLCELSRREGIVVLDVMFANPDRVRSMAFATNRNNVWTEDPSGCD